MKILAIDHQGKSYVVDYKTRDEFTMTDHSRRVLESKDLGILDKERIATTFDKVTDTKPPVQVVPMMARGAIKVIDNRRPIFLVIAAVLLALGIGFGVYYFHAIEGKEHTLFTPSEQIQAPADSDR